MRDKVLLDSLLQYRNYFSYPQSSITTKLQYTLFSLYDKNVSPYTINTQLFDYNDRENSIISQSQS